MTSNLRLLEVASETSFSASAIWEGKKMELTKIEIPVAANRPEDIQGDVQELCDLQLALVGGGIGNVILG